MKRVLLLIVIIGLVVSCKQIGDKDTAMTLADSLGWQNSEDYFFSADCSIKCRDSKLYILDAVNKKLSIFNENKLDFVRSIGKSGRGPGEFTFPLCFTFDNEGNFIVADFSNSMIQWLSPAGEYIKSVKAPLPGEVYNFDGDIYYTDYAGKPEMNLYKIVDHKPVVDLSITDLITGSELPEGSNKRFALAKTDKKLIISFLHFKDKILEIDTNKYFETTLRNSAHGLSSCMVVDDKSIFVILYSLEKDLSQTITDLIEGGREHEICSNLLAEEVGLKSYLVEYSFDGSIVNTHRLPNNILGKEFSFAKSENNIYLQDVFSGIIYKYKM